MAVVYLVSRRSVPRAGIAGLGVAVAVAGALLAYPLWFQFAGPQHYGKVPALWLVQYSDAASYVTYSTQALAGSPPYLQGIQEHFAEENAYYGWPLLILALALAVWLRRLVLARVAVVVGVVFAALSLGRSVVVYGHDTGIPGPYRLVSKLPVVESVVPVRYALLVIPAVALLLALGLDRVRAAEGPRLIWYAAFVGALLPLLPTPLPVATGPHTPAFVSAGIWRRYVPAGRSAVFVPVPTYAHVESVKWSAGQRLDLPIAGGYFLGPGPDQRAIYGAPPRPTATLLDQVAGTGQVPAVTDADRARTAEDLAYWRAAVVVVGPVPNADALRDTVRDLLGREPQWVGGAWVWDLRTR